MPDRPLAPQTAGAMPPHIAALRVSVMAPELGTGKAGRGAADRRGADAVTVRLDGDGDTVRATDAAERFVVVAARKGGPSAEIRDFELGADVLRFAGRKPADDVRLAWVDADGDGTANDLLVGGGRGVLLVDLGGNGSGEPTLLPTAEDLFQF